MARLLVFFLLFISFSSFSQSLIPVPDHIVILIMENHAFNQIIGNKDAPNINSLAKSSNTALFTQSYGVTYPSQPNYINIFSGCNQGIVDDNPPKTIPFSSDNLGRQLLDVGKTFISYAEDLPQVGFDGANSGHYVRRHNPAVYWIGNGTNQLPPAVIQPLTAFPDNFSLLPTVCFIVPNNINNMHDGSVSQGDKWMYSHLFSYIQWAKTHNSLFILTFDEDNKSQDNRVATLFAGEMVKAGSYSQKINHLNVLRTIEEMYGLRYACDALESKSVTDCWDVTDSTSADDLDHQFAVYLNTNRQNITIANSNNSPNGDLKFFLSDIYGHTIIEKTIPTAVSTIQANELIAGIYIYQLSANNKLLQKGKIVIP